MFYKLLLRYGILLITIFAFFAIQVNAQSTPPACSPPGSQLMEMDFDQDVAAYQTKYGSFNYEYRNSYYLSHWIVNLPFTFCYDNKQYTRIYQDGNGHLMFLPYRPGNIYTYPYYFYMMYSLYMVYQPSNGGAAYYMKNWLSAWAGMMYGYAYNPNGHVGYNFSGTAPNRVATFEWYNNTFHHNGNNPVTVQIQLHENGNIVFHYDQVRCGYDYYFSSYVPLYNYYYYLPYIY